MYQQPEYQTQQPSYNPNYNPNFDPNYQGNAPTYQQPLIQKQVVTTTQYVSPPPTQYVVTQPQYVVTQPLQPKVVVVGHRSPRFGPISLMLVILLFFLGFWPFCLIPFCVPCDN